VRVPRNREHPLGVSPPNLVRFARLLESFGRELPDRLEEPVALLAQASGAPTYQALIEEGGERIEIRAADVFCWLERTAAAEDAEPGE
jgi:hypothetical protein